jgi:hypothetical protein
MHAIGCFRAGRDCLGGSRRSRPVRCSRGADRHVQRSCGCSASAGASWPGCPMRGGPRDVREAKWDAAGSNTEWDRETSGKRRTNADKRRAVRMAWEANRKATGREVAGHTGVSPRWAAEIIKRCENEVANSAQSRNNNSGSGVRSHRESVAEKRFNSTNEMVDGPAGPGTRSPVASTRAPSPSGSRSTVTRAGPRSTCRGSAPGRRGLLTPHGFLIRLICRPSF